MMENFEKASIGLMEISSKSFEENRSENAIYGVCICKPSRRLSTLLSINREVLVLFTSFEEQQARTIKMIRKIIVDNKGRLESTVAVVFHPDPSGNVRLKAWGRENGISILPIFYKKDDYPMQPEQFENLLCRELFSIDPFDISGPVSDDSQFYGRRTEAQTIARQLQQGQIKSILGIRKTGKTSILNRIVDTCKKYHDCIVIMIDCSTDRVWSLHASDLLYSIYKSVCNLIDNNNNYTVLSVEHSQMDIGECSAVLAEKIVGFQKTVILTFDEFDYITPSSPTGSHWVADFNLFWRNFRAVYQECMRNSKPFSVLISGVSSKWFRVESVNNVENAALAMIPEEYLYPLPRRASISMIRSMSRVAGLQFTEDAANLVANTCCDVPYWIRKACSYIHKRTDITSRPIKIDLHMVQDLTTTFINDEGAIISKVALDHLFRVYPELKNYCQLCYSNQYDKIPKAYINVLEKYGFLTSLPDGGVCISGVMLKEGLSIVFDTSHNDDSQVITFENPVQDDYEDWADELALIGKRRNILERKMRSIVLNFIRQDSLCNKDKPRAKDRILKRIEEKRRKQLENLSPEALMDKLLWTELCIIIDKEWALFGGIFNDKNLFNLNCSVINDRYDAHAKPADLADLALYRRSLTWVESCINAI